MRGAGVIWRRTRPRRGPMRGTARCRHCRNCDQPGPRGHPDSGARPAGRRRRGARPGRDRYPQTGSEANPGQRNTSNHPSTSSNSYHPCVLSPCSGRHGQYAPGDVASSCPLGALLRRIGGLPFAQSLERPDGRPSTPPRYRSDVAPNQVSPRFARRVRRAVHSVPNPSFATRSRDVQRLLMTM